MVKKIWKVFFNIIPFLLLCFQTTVAQKINSRYNETWGSEPQKTLKRMDKGPLRLIKKIDLEKAEIFRPYLLDVDTDGNIAFFDFGKQHIIYIPEGDIKQAKEFGKGRGGGPREFRGVFDLKLDVKGNLWISDKNLHRITQWSSTGVLLHTLIPPKDIQPTRIAPCEDGSSYILSRLYNPNGILHLLNSEGEQKVSFQKLKTELSRSPFIFDGEITCYDNDLYFAGRYKGFIRKYTPKGKMLYSKRAEAFEANKNILQTDKKGNVIATRLSKDTRRANGDIYIADNKLYVGFSGKKNDQLYYLDVYNPENGVYQYSYQFANPVQEFTIKDQTIYTLEYKGKQRRVDLGIYKLPRKTK